MAERQRPPVSFPALNSSDWKGVRVMTNNQQPTPEDIQLEMSVKTSERILDKGDVSGSQATQLIPYQQGQAKELMAEKGLFGQKGLMLPIGQVQAVEHARDRPIPGTVVIQVSEVRGAGFSAWTGGVCTRQPERSLLPE
jgi:hypothetical protein